MTHPHPSPPPFQSLQHQWSKQLLEDHLKAIQRFRRGWEIHQQWEINVGQTPHDVVYEEGKIRLLHYRASTPRRFKTPLLIVFSLINRSYILDLKPGKSIVEKMVAAGFDVYLIDWGIPGPADRYLTLDDYINRYMERMVHFIQKDASVETVSILGYCMGGTMAAMYAALYPKSVQNLLLMAAPFDFSKREGLLFIWADKDHLNVDKLVDALGNIPPWFLQSAFTLMKPMQNLVDKYIKFYEKMEDPQFVDDFLTLEYWLNDNIPLAGPVYKQFVEDCFHHNRLIQNQMMLGDHRVDLTQISCPVLSIVAEQDHLVPSQSSLVADTAFSSQDTSTIVFPAGHIGLSISGRAMKTLWPQVAEWLEKRSVPLLPDSSSDGKKGKIKLRPKKQKDAPG